MFFLLLIQSTLGLFDLQLDKYDSFQIEFDPTCTQYFTLLGETDYVNLSQSEGNIMLLVGGKDSSQTYTTTKSDYLVFSWPDKTVNGAAMYLTEGVGEFEMHLNLNFTSIPCKVYGLKLGSLFADTQASSLTYDCPTISNWKIYFPAAVAVALSLMLAVGGYKTIEPRILRRRLEQMGEAAATYNEDSRYSRV